jgi:hypothetical protein
MLPVHLLNSNAGESRFGYFLSGAKKTVVDNVRVADRLEPLRL